jgi:hypothetical protein
MPIQSRAIKTAEDAFERERKIVLRFMTDLMAIFKKEELLERTDWGFFEECFMISSPRSRRSGRRAGCRRPAR